MKTWSALQIVDWMRAYNFAQMKDNENIEELSQMKAMKLLYYAQGISLASFDTKLFNEDLVAWKYGPVVSEVYNVYKGKRNIVHITTKDDFVVSDESGIDEEAREVFEKISKDSDSRIVLETVMENFGNMTAIELMNKTHHETPWQETKQSEKINIDLLKKYFKEEIMA